MPMSDEYARGRRDGLRLALTILTAEEEKWSALLGESPSWRTNAIRKVRHKTLQVARKRVQTALKVLEAIGGAAEAEKHGDKIVIRSNGCPLAAAVSVHPEVCRLAETLLSEVVKVPVVEQCNREGRPKCRFEIDAA